MKKQNTIIVAICIFCVIASLAYADISTLNTNMNNINGLYNLSLNNLSWSLLGNSWMPNNLLLQRMSSGNIFNTTSMLYNPLLQSPMSYLYSNPNSRMNYGYNLPSIMPFTTNFGGITSGGLLAANPLTNIYSFGSNLANLYTGNLWNITVPMVTSGWGPTSIGPVYNNYLYAVPSSGLSSVVNKYNPSINYYNTSTGGSAGIPAYSWGAGSSYGLYQSVSPNFSISGGGGSYYSGGYGMAYGGFASYNYIPSSNIGYSTGGSKDINNFRQNIDNDYLPIATDVTYEGLFYDYYFDTGQQEECTELFCPSYMPAVTADPLSGDKEYFMSVGLNSGIKKEDFHRKKLNLVVVLDVSGSMSSRFNSYYYDRFGDKHVVEAGEDLSQTKMEVADEALVALIDHLNAEDRFGLVLFNGSAWTHHSLALIGETNVQQLKNDIMGISASGSTNLASGMQMATSKFTPFIDIDHTEYENRIIFLTDMMPNTGDTSSKGLLGMAKNNANNKIYSTFIGIGVDFNTELVEYITKIRGANYYSVFSPTRFREQMDEEFEFMVTPLVFNLELSFASVGFQIEKVYGSPEADESTGELMKVNTLFPSKTTEGGTKGGIIILKLSRLDPNSITAEDANQIELNVSYEDRLGDAHSTSEIITFGDIQPEYFESSGIRKGILLTRYANLLKNWIIDERTSLKDDVPVESFMGEEDGMSCIPIYTSVEPYVAYRCYPPTSPIPLEASVNLGQWERQSTALRVSDPYKQSFTAFKAYFEAEMAAIGDSTLSQEVDVLDKLSTY